MKGLLLMLILSLNVSAGDKGNGGGVHYCSHSGKVELYDLYEGFVRYDIRRTHLETSTEKHLNRALFKLRNQPWLKEHVARNLSYLKKPGSLLMRPLINLQRIDDANILVTDVGCTYEQLANWDDASNKVMVRQEYWEKLDDLNKAAFYLHEALYKVVRDNLDLKNSDKVRRNVAQLLSDEDEVTVDYFTQAHVVHVTTNPAPESYQVIDTKGDAVKVVLHTGDKNFYGAGYKLVVLIEGKSGIKMTEFFETSTMSLDFDSKVTIKLFKAGKLVKENVIPRMDWAPAYLKFTVTQNPQP